MQMEIAGLVEQLQAEVTKRDLVYRPVETFKEFTHPSFSHLVTGVLDLYRNGTRSPVVEGDFHLFYMGQLLASIPQSTFTGIDYLKRLAHLGCIFSLDIIIKFLTSRLDWEKVREYQTMAAKHGHSASRHALALYYSQHPSWEGVEFARLYGFASLERILRDSFTRLEEEQSRFLLLLPTAQLSPNKREDRGRLLNRLSHLLKREETYFRYYCVADITRLIFQYLE